MTPIPWVSIITWLVTFLLSASKKGMSAGKAAILATGAAIGAYYVADPANPKNLMGFGTSTDNQSGDPNSSQTSGDTTTTSGSGYSSSGSFGNNLVSEMGQTFRSWGASGTALVAGTVSATSSGNKNIWVWLGLGALALVVLK